MAASITAVDNTGKTQQITPHRNTKLFAVALLIATIASAGLCFIPGGALVGAPLLAKIGMVGGPLVAAALLGLIRKLRSAIVAHLHAKVQPLQPQPQHNQLPSSPSAADSAIERHHEAALPAELEAHKKSLAIPAPSSQPISPSNVAATEIKNSDIQRLIENRRNFGMAENPEEFRNELPAQVDMKNLQTAFYYTNLLIAELQIPNSTENELLTALVKNSRHAEFCARTVATIVFSTLPREQKNNIISALIQNPESSALILESWKEQPVFLINPNDPQFKENFSNNLEWSFRNNPSWNEGIQA